MAGQENQQYTVLYGRLSQEDERAGESNSIQHQRTLLEKYAKEKGFENTIFLADDGYSGTNLSARRGKDRGDNRSRTGGKPHRKGRLPLGA